MIAYLFGYEQENRTWLTSFLKQDAKGRVNTRPLLLKIATSKVLREAQVLTRFLK